MTDSNLNFGADPTENQSKHVPLWAAHLIAWALSQLRKVLVKNREWIRVKWV